MTLNTSFSILHFDSRASWMDALLRMRALGGSSTLEHWAGPTLYSVICFDPFPSSCFTSQIACFYIHLQVRGVFLGPIGIQLCIFLLLF